MRKLIHFDSETIMGKFKYPFFSKIQFSTNHRYRKIPEKSQKEKKKLLPIEGQRQELHQSFSKKSASKNRMASSFLVEILLL